MARRRAAGTPTATLTHALAPTHLIRPLRPPRSDELDGLMRLAYPDQPPEGRRPLGTHALAAAAELPWALGFELTAAYAELRPGEARCWERICGLLTHARADPPSQPTTHAMALAEAVATWWAPRLSWWPEACFGVHSVPADATSAMWAARRRCASLLVSALRGCPARQELAQQTQLALMRVLKTK